MVRFNLTTFKGKHTSGCISFSMFQIHFIQTLILLCLLIFLSATSQAQRQRLGKIKKNDGVYLRGKILFDPSKPDTVSFLQLNYLITSFGADEVEYFQLEGKNPYVSRTIIHDYKRKAVLLEKVISGPVTYLYLQDSPDRFFVEHDELLELTNRYLNEMLINFAPDCSRWQRQLDNSPLHHKKVRFIVNEINNGKCRNIPYATIGIFGSWFLSQHTISKDAFGYNIPDELNNNLNNYSFGLYMDIPAWNIPGFNLRYQAGFYQHLFSHTFRIDDANYSTLKIDRADLMFEIMPVFQFNSEIIRPYFFAGPALTLNLNNGSEIKRYTAVLNVIRERLNPLDANIFSPGISAGAGIKYHYKPEAYLALEFKTTHVAFGNGHKTNLWQAGVSANIINF